MENIDLDHNVASVIELEESQTSSADIQWDENVLNDENLYRAFLNENSIEYINSDSVETLQSPTDQNDVQVFSNENEIENPMVNNEELDENSLATFLLFNNEEPNPPTELLNFGNRIDRFGLISELMMVTVQPQLAQRARYASDGSRFLPGAKTNPVRIKIPNLLNVPLEENECFGIILTMVTTKKNPQQKTFVHINKIVYRTGDAIDLGFGSVFVPLKQSDIEKCEKAFPRLSVICKKLREFTFELTSFDTETSERITQQYTIENQNTKKKAANGKQFIIDYDLLCYKIVFQLACKTDDVIRMLDNQCETEVINEQKIPRSLKRKATSNDDNFTNENNDSRMKKSKSSVEKPSIIRSTKKKTTRSKRSPKKSCKSAAAAGPYPN